MRPASNLINGRQLRAARVLAGLTQRTLGAALGVDDRAVRFCGRGVTDLSSLEDDFSEEPYFGIVSDMKLKCQPTPCSRKPGRPTSYRREYCLRVIALMAEGRSLDGCAALLGVHPDSLYEWQKVHPEFSEAVRAGRAAATAFWETRLLDVAQGGSGNAQAIQWALRNRSRAASGWDHAHAKLEVSGPDGGAVQFQSEVAVIDARLLTPDQRDALKQALLAAQAQGELGA